MAAIRFFTEDVVFKIAHPRKTVWWITEVARREKRQIEDLNFIFCSDEYLLRLNVDFLSHNTLTDIITFDYSEKKGGIIGEIYISIDRVAENAMKFKNSFGDELDRVMVHGLLHLLGYKDKKPSEKALMRKKEEACLSLRE